MISVLIAEDEIKMQKHLQKLFAHGDEIKVLETVVNSDEVISTLKKSKPDVLLLDLVLEDGNAINLIRKFIEKSPNTKVLVLTIYEDEDNLIQAVKNGAKGYILKDESDELIIESIKMVHVGGSPLTQKLAQKLISILEPTTPENILTERQLEILRMIAVGFTYKDIAKKLHISPLTVRTHIRNIYDELEVKSKGEALLKGRRLGILRKF